MDKATTQIKFTIESAIVESFKARCAYEGVRMTSAARQWMKASSHYTKETAINTSTRSLRRKAVESIIGFLTDIMDAETVYRDKIPEQFVQRYVASDYTCTLLSDAICSLEEAF